MKKKKILFIWHGGVVETYQKYIEELAKYDDLDVTLLLPEWSIEGSQKVTAYIPKDAKYKVIVAKGTAPQEPLINIFPSLPYYLWKIKPDIVHLFEEPWHNIAIYLDFWMNIIGRFHKMKLIFQTFQNQIEDYQKNWQFVQNMTFKTSSAAISCTNDGVDVLKHWGYKKPIYFIYPGIETKLFGFKDSTHLREKLGLTKFTIGYFGRMIKDKGVEDLIEGCKKLQFPYQLLMIGEGSDKKYFQTLTDNAIWLSAVSPNEISEYYSALNLLVLPSRTTPRWKEQFGRVLAEAMLCGIPVIGSSSGEIQNVIGDASLIFDEGDSKDLSRKIWQIYQDKELRDKIIEKGLERAKEFDWSITAKKVYEVYKNLEQG